MARFRQIHKKIWKDPDFQEMPQSHKLAFLYLCTNEATSESGIYPLTAKTLSAEASIDLEAAQTILSNGNLKNVHYDQTNRLVFVRNLRRYNLGGAPSLIEKAIVYEYETTKKSDLWLDFCSEYPEYINPLITYDKHLLNRLETFDKTLLAANKGEGSFKGSVIGKSSSSSIEPLPNRLETVGKVFQLYEDCCGKLNMNSTNKLNDWIDHYGEAKVIDAIKKADNQGKRFAAYIEGILEGRGEKLKGKLNPRQVPSKYTKPEDL